MAQRPNGGGKSRLCSASSLKIKNSCKNVCINNANHTQARLTFPPVPNLKLVERVESWLRDGATSIEDDVCEQGGTLALAGGAHVGGITLRVPATDVCRRLRLSAADGASMHDSEACEHGEARLVSPVVKIEQRDGPPMSKVCVYVCMCACPACG
jgi:hypothetical protein